MQFAQHGVKGGSYKSIKRVKNKVKDCFLGLLFCFLFCFGFFFYEPYSLLRISLVLVFLLECSCHPPLIHIKPQVYKLHPHKWSLKEIAAFAHL